jgi:uncharacterized lipoprotein YddW (UPF0748 family)
VQPVFLPCQSGLFEGTRPFSGVSGPSRLCTYAHGPRFAQEREVIAAATEHAHDTYLAFQATFSPLRSAMERRTICANPHFPLLASNTSSYVRKPVRGAQTRTAMLPGLCSFLRMRTCALGISSQV